LNFIVAQTNKKPMEKIFIKTKLGNIAVFKKEINAENIPIVFVHGVYVDHHLWDNQIATITDKTMIAIDIPWHAQKDWNE
jgi:3-oxoadipate enol-lactonase